MASRRRQRGTKKKPRRISLRELAAIEARIEREAERGVPRPRGWGESRERKPKLISAEHIIEIARIDPNEAVDTARRVHFHPDDWAGAMAAEFDLSVHDVYSSYFNSPPTRL